MAERGQRLGLGEPRAVAVGAIEQGLCALWRSAAAAPTVGPALTRACALTLLIYTEDEAELPEIGSRVAAVTAQNPCRAIVMVARPEAKPDGLRAWISAHCHLPVAGEKQVCCEQVSIVARGESVQDLDNVVVPLTVPGLPVFLWWRAGKFAPPAYFRHLLRVTNRVLVDSARFAAPELDLAALVQHADRLAPETTLADLNWTRLTPWRELMAQSFDGADRLTYLRDLNRVSIEFERASPRVAAQHAQALLLIGWLASRLAWTLEGRGVGETSSFRFRSPSGPVTAECVPREFDRAGAGVCFSIRLAAEGESPATFTFARRHDGKNVITRSEMPGQPAVESAANVEVWEESRLLNHEMMFSGHDGVFEAALGMVRRMVSA
jgi:glucose-6-phosphate dehydrogenase assembly protein OpcA